MQQFPDYYKTLELDREASPEQVWLSFHKFNFLHERHIARPRLPPLADVVEAYLVLSHTEIKQQYDYLYDHERRFGLPFEVRRKLAVFLIGLLSVVITILLLHFA